MQESSFSPEPVGQLRLFDDQLEAAQAYARQFGRIHRPVEGVLPTGSLTMDAAMGIGGLPRGRIVELFGGPSVGKSTLALQMVAAVQREGGIAAYVDSEGTFDPIYAARIGVSLEDLLLVRPGEGEILLRIVAKLVEGKAVDFIVVDSVAALTPPDPLPGQPENPFLHSEMMASGLRRISRLLVSSPACVLLVNQTRAYYGVGYSETSTGGMAVKIHAAVRAELRTLKESGTCRTVRIRIAKTHFGEKRMFDFTLSDGVGIWEHTDLAERGIDAGLLVRGESGFSFRGRDVAKSYRDLLECLQSDCALAAEVKLAVQADLGMPQRKPASSAQHVVQPKVVGL
jgi:recombination protein RecA